MMEELALHILDIVENSLKGGASEVEIRIHEDARVDSMAMEFTDNGRGIPPAILETIFDPFVTTRTERRVGLGLSFFRQAARQCGGDVTLTSSPDRGTQVLATFGLSHPDRQPMGDLGATVATLLAGANGTCIIMTIETDHGDFTLDSRDLVSELGDDCFQNGMVLNFVSETINEKRKELGAAP